MLHLYLFFALLVTMVDGEYLLVSGTSAACATFAGMVSLVNAYRIEFGLSNTGNRAMGFVNRVLQ